MFKRFFVAIPAFLAGLYCYFGIPSYLDRAPDWYFQLPSVLPSTMWAPFAKGLGVIFMVVALIIAIPWNKFGKRQIAGDVCTRCGKPFTTETQKLTRVWDRTGDAHFDCYYPLEVRKPHAYELPKWAIDKLPPDIAIWFKPTSR